MPQPGGCDWAAISRRLRRCAAGLTERPEEAEDLAQQTLAALLARRRERADHLGYARRTMLRLWLDHERSLRRRLRRIARVARTVPSWHQDRDRVDEAEVLEHLRRATAALPPRQRAALVLRLIEGLEYRAIAEILDCSVPSVRANLHLARAKLRRVMGEEP